MRRLSSWIGRRRGAAAEPPAAVAAGEAPKPRPAGGRTRRLFVAVGVLVAIAAGAVLSLQLLPADEPAREPAVPPGQLAVEMREQDAAAAGASITIEPAAAEALGLRTAAVEMHAPDATVRTTGRVVPDERRTSEVHTKVEGWIEETFADFEGEAVRKGQPLFSVYSPELLATQQELLLALRARRDFERSEFDVVRASGDSLVEVARRRLRLFDMTAEQIAELERTGTPRRAVTVYAPASGVVTERKAFPGTRVTPDMTLYRLAELSPIWVEADVFEGDLPAVRIGAPAEVTLPGGEARAARVTFINPMVVPETRTARVRLELPNPGLALKPGMFVDVALTGRREPQLAVPRDAVLDTGARQLVLVDEGEGRFVLREVRTGMQGQELVTVLSGLAAGERVARNIQFLVDSETRLRDAVGRQSAGAPAAEPPAPGTSHAGH